MESQIPGKLRNTIIQSLSHSLRRDCTDQDIPLQRFFRSSKTDLSGSFIDFHELRIEAEEIYFSESLLLIVRSREIVVYNYNKEYELKLVKSISGSYLHYKRDSLSKSVRTFLYKVYLYLMEAKVYRTEAWIEAVMNYLNVEQIVEVLECVEGIKVIYKTNVIRGFGEYLQDLNPEIMVEQENSLNTDRHLIRITKSGLKIRKHGSALVEVRKIEGIRGYCVYGSFIGLLLKRKIVIARFM